MKTIKNLLSIFIITIAFTFVSCENEPIDQSLINNTNSGNNSGGGNSGGGGNSSSILIKKAIFTYPGNIEEVVNYVYNGNKILEMNYEGTDEKTVFEYTGNLITADYEYSGTTMDEKYVYQYNSSNKMITAKAYSYSAGVETLESEYFYTHNSNNTVTVIKKQNSITVSNGVIHFIGNQPYKYVETLVSNGQVITIECEYDSKNNAVSNIVGYDNYVLNSPESGFEGIGRNAIKTSENGSIIDQFTYNYNSNNYPTSATMSFNGQTINLQILYN